MAAAKTQINATLNQPQQSEIQKAERLSQSMLKSDDVKNLQQPLGQLKKPGGADQVPEEQVAAAVSSF